MKKFTTACFDNKTGYRMIYSDCTFNAAMFQLESEGFVCESVRKDEFNPDLKCVIGTYKERKKVFLWDDDRMLLMSDEKIRREGI